MNSLGVIYGLRVKGSGEIRYVGQTISPNKRLNHHRYEARSEHAYLPLYRWMAKHGPEEVEMVILEPDVPVDGLDDRETHWIGKLRTFQGDNPRGLNLTRTGRGQELAPSALKRKRQASRRNYVQKFRETLESRRPGLSAEEVAGEIRRRFAGDPNLLVSDIQREYNLDRAQVQRVLENISLPDPEYVPPATLYKKRSRAGRRDSQVGAPGKLDWGVADEIRDVWAAGDLSMKEIGALYGVDQTSVWHVIDNRTWHNPEYTNPRPYGVSESTKKKISAALSGRPKPPGFGKKGSQNKSAKLTEVEVQEIIRKLHTGGKGRDVAKEFNITEATISKIRTNQTWCHLPRPWKEEE